MYWTDSGKLPETALAEILRDDAMILMQNLEMGRGSLRPNKKISYSLPALDLLECSNRFLMLHLKIARSLFYGAAKTVFFFNADLCRASETCTCSPLPLSVHSHPFGFLSSQD